MRPVLVCSILLALAGLGGCGGKRIPIGGAGLQVVSTEALPQPGAADYRAAGRPSYLGAFDKLRVDVFGVEDLTREIQVDAGGRFTFPLIGEVEGGGKTTAEVAREIETRLRGRFVRRPSVTVNLIESSSQVVTVDGQVIKPGQYPVTGRMTLIRAVAAAQGTSELAATEEVIVFRTVGDNRYAGIYDLASIRRGRYADPDIFAGDVIVVGDSPSRRAFRNLIQASGLITAPLIVALQRL